MGLRRVAAIHLALLVGSSTLAPLPAIAEPLPLSVAPFEAERLERDATIRGNQLQLHQGLALATLGTMAVTAGLGAYASNFAALEQHPLLHGVHMGLGGVTTGLYLSAASLALTAPQGYAVEREGWDAMTLHRALAWLHAAALASTVTLGVLTSVGTVPPSSHGIAGATTLGLLTLSAGVIVLDF